MALTTTEDTRLRELLALQKSVESSGDELVGTIAAELRDLLLKQQETTTGGGAKPFFQPQPAPDFQSTGAAGDSQLPGGAGGGAMTIDQIVAAMNAGTLSPFDAQRQLSAILQQEGLTSADAFQRATSFLLGRVTAGSDAERALFAAQGFTGTDRPGGEAEQVLPGTPASSRASLEDVRRQRAGQFRNVFSEFLAVEPQFQGVNTLVRNTLQNRFNPALASFLLGSVSPDNAFRDFLPSGGILSPTEGANRIAEVAAFGAGGAPLSFGQQNIVDNFSLFSGDPARSGAANEGAFGVALATLLPGVSAPFRPQTRRSAQRIFDRFQATTPQDPFLQFLGERGGNIFGQVGSSGNPFAAFS